MKYLLPLKLLTTATVLPVRSRLCFRELSCKEQVTGYNVAIYSNIYIILYRHNTTLSLVTCGLSLESSNLFLRKVESYPTTHTTLNTDHYSVHNVAKVLSFCTTYATSCFVSNITSSKLSPLQLFNSINCIRLLTDLNLYR